MRKFNRIIALILVTLTLVAALAASAFAAESAKREFSDGASVTVNLEYGKKGLQNGKVKIQTYDILGFKSSAKVHVMFLDLDGNWVCEFDAKSGDTLKLGNDHEGYQIFLTPRSGLSQPANFINVGKCVSWSVTAKSNCSVE
jgi:hypothetical protein